MTGGSLGPEPAGSRTAWQVQRAVVFAIVLREMKARVGGQWVGAVWTVFEPMAHMAVMVTWLGFLRHVASAQAEYPVFLVTGLIPYFYFQKLVVRLLDCVDGNRGLFAYRQVKPFDAFIGRAIVETLMNLTVYGITLGLLGWLGYHVIPALPLEMIATNLLIAVLGTSLGIFLAVASHDRPRLRSLIRLAFYPLYIASGVLFSVDTLPREFVDWLLWNPVLHLIELSRHSFIPSYTPADGVSEAYPAACALVATAAALSIYRAKRLRLLASS